MPDSEAKKKTEIKKSAVSAPVEIGKPKEGSEKDIRWYVIHTYSGYENKVKDTLTRKVHSMGMDDTIIQILLPMHDEEEVKDGEKKVVSRKVFPGYLLIQMEVNDRSWYVVRNTPIPLSDEEAKRIIEGKDKKQTAKTDAKVGDTIKITRGPFADRSAVVLDVSDDRSKIKADISNFGTTTTIELEVGYFDLLHK